jgi:N-carbamoyl-L-amino-acid hydrolase
MRIDGDRLLRELHELAGFTEPAQSAAAATAGVPDVAVTRVVFTERDREARAWLRGLAEEAGLDLRVDAVGNTFYRWQGAEPGLAAVATGSHIDAIPNAGMFDGTVGVLGGLEAIRALKASGFMPRRAIELVLFTSEEPTRFGVGCLGSRLMAGVLSAEADETLCGTDGMSLRKAREKAGSAGALGSVQLPAGHYAGFVELHIEQGPLLEREGLDIGVVTAIAAPAAGFVTLTGFGGHAGALLMPDRRDALAGAAEVVLAVERAALAAGAVDAVATVGICEVFPGAVNSVPSLVRLSLDVRDIDEARRDRMLGVIFAALEEIISRRGLRVEREMVNADAPAGCAHDILMAIEASCGEAGVRSRRMVSRAYHDSLFMARVCPVGMIFVPSRGGVSHRPDEYTESAELVRGVEVLARTLRRMSLG